MNDRPSLLQETWPMPSELDALSAAKSLIGQHGAKEAWRILIARAVEEQGTGDLERQTITVQVLTALLKLTQGPAPDQAVH